MNSIRKWIIIGVLMMAGSRGGTQPLPLDPAVRTGKLSNGFTYYIRHNGEPARQVQMYLVCNVGSILEDDDQRGLAHFMEHMNFNGTRHYPKNELVDYLQRAGVRFGADLNAHTGFDETVYQLPLPTEDPSLVMNGLQIMRDWAQEALLDPSEIEKERGIVLEEERLGKGARDRMMKQYLPVLVNHSRYADRMPIGLDSILIHFRSEVIRRFHHDWYRPDLQALIVVGDIDAAVMEKMVKEKFSDLRNPASRRARVEYRVPVTGRGQFIAVTDKEAAATELEIMVPHQEPVLSTVADYRQAMVRTLFGQMLSDRRYAELSRDPRPSYVGCSMGIQSFIGGMDVFDLSVTAKERELERAFQQCWDVVEKVRRFGFTSTELARAKENYLRTMESAVREKDKTPSVSYVGEYQRHFLHGEGAPGIEWEYNYVKQHIAGITLDDIRAVTKEYVRDSGYDVLITAPEKDKDRLPSGEVVASWIRSEKGRELVAYRDSVAAGPLMAVKPRPGRVVSRKEIAAIGVTEVMLDNGLRLVLKPTTFKNDEITFKAFAPGGTSLYNDTDYDAAAGADRMITSFGVGDLDPVALNKVLAGKVVRVAPYIGPRSEGITGTAAPADLETALQLVHLYFTRPRKDDVLYQNIIGKSRAAMDNRYADPNNVFSDTMAYVIGGYAYRASPPAVSKLDRITLEKVYDVYRQRFADASGFTFVFTGNFKVDEIVPLLSLYLGSLPSTGKHEQARDLGTHIPGGKLVKNVYKGKEDKALVRLVYSGDYQYGFMENLYLHALGQILQIKVLQHLREQEGEVYSPSVQTVYNKYPRNRYAVFVSFGCAPGNVDHLVEMVQQEMDTLRLKGPEPDDMEKYKAGYLKNLELALRDNGFWLGYLAGQYENGEDVLEVLDQEKNLAKVTPEMLKEAAGRLLDGRNIIRFVLLPDTVKF